MTAKESVPPTSTVEQMEALSKELLDEKNAEIDELQNKIQELEKKDSSSESSDDEEVTFVR